MKKNILKAITCLCVMGLIWSCNTESDVQMQQDNNSQAQLKGGSILEEEIAEEVGDGTYRFIVDKEELVKALERLSEEQGDVIDITYLEIKDVSAVNDPSLKGVVLFAGTGNTGSTSKTMGFQLVKNAPNFSIKDPFGVNEDTVDPASIICRGCGQGCFIEYYRIDGHLVGYCDPAGCGVWCEKVKK